MNNFISAFYDAVLLYAIALNETLSEGLDPRNGKDITSKMWNRTFVGRFGRILYALAFFNVFNFRNYWKC